MPKYSTSVVIHAPQEVVFSRVAEPGNFVAANDRIIDVEILSAIRSGVGTRFCEKRSMGNKTSESVLEITEYERDQRVRFVCDQGGTVWDTVYTLAEHDQACTLRLVMDARPHQFWARLMTPLIMGWIKRAIDEDLDGIKSYCESVQGAVEIP